MNKYALASLIVSLAFSSVPTYTITSSNLGTTSENTQTTEKKWNAQTIKKALVIGGGIVISFLLLRKLSQKSPDKRQAPEPKKSTSKKKKSVSKKKTIKPVPAPEIPEKTIREQAEDWLDCATLMNQLNRYIIAPNANQGLRILRIRFTIRNTVDEFLDLRKRDDYLTWNRDNADKINEHIEKLMADFPQTPYENQQQQIFMEAYQLEAGVQPANPLEEYAAFTRLVREWQRIKASDLDERAQAYQLSQFLINLIQQA